MIQALNIPYSSKTDEIMSRYRPIAPKPEIPNNSIAATATATTSATTASLEVSLVPEKFRQSPYLRNIWSHLQARPTRTRKRGRTSAISSSTLLRKQHDQQQQQQQQRKQQVNSGTAGGPTYMGLCYPSPLQSTTRNLSVQASGVIDADRQACNINTNTIDNVVVELPLFGSSKPIDLNSVVADASATTTSVLQLEEKDLLLQLQVPAPAAARCASSCGKNTPTSVISPRPVRPVGSSVTIIGKICEDPKAQVVIKTPEEVEVAAEAEALPTIISDRSNKVRMVNSAYKELVGQPECPWLNSMCSGGGRISGEVMLQVLDTGLPVLCNGFSCWIRIEWESEQEKRSVNAFCEAVKLACVSKDYMYSWRFHTREVSPSGSKV